MFHNSIIFSKIRIDLLTHSLQIEMKNLLLCSSFLVALIACETTTESEQEQTIDVNKNTPVKIEFTDYQFSIDSLSTKKTELEVEIKLVKKEFDFKQQDFSGRSYYHKNWSGKYYISDQAVLAGVDSTGNFFLIANVWTNSYRTARLDPIQIELAGANYFAESDTLFSFIEPLNVVCACGFHQAYFTNINAHLIGRKISENPFDEITWVGIKTLTKRDKMGIKKSFDLSEKLRAIVDIDNQIEQLHKLLSKSRVK